MVVYFIEPVVSREDAVMCMKKSFDTVYCVESLWILVPCGCLVLKVVKYNFNYQMN